LKALVIDLGGSHATLAMVEDRLIVGSEELALDRAQGLNAALPLFVETFGRLLARLGGSMHSCDGLVFGFCGLADVRTGRVLSTNKKYDDAPSLDLPQWCRREFGIPFRLENDARMALLAEVYAGAAMGVGDVVMMTLGTGIGGAAMMGGQLAPPCDRAWNWQYNSLSAWCLSSILGRGWSVDEGRVRPASRS
jgi:glucokinase